MAYIHRRTDTDTATLAENMTDRQQRRKHSKPKKLKLMVMRKASTGKRI